MAEILVMPKLGLTMEEGVVARWLCEPGTVVALGQGICEVETDKLSVVVESPYAGMLLRCIEPDATVPVGEPIAVIGEPGEESAGYRLYQPADSGASTLPAPAGAPPPAGPPQPAAAAVSWQDRPAEGTAQESPAPATAQREAAASPLARRIAATLGIDLAAVDGTGPAGRITKEDVERAAASLGLAVPPTSEGGFR